MSAEIPAASPRIRKRRLSRLLFGLLVCFLLLFAAYWLWFTHRPQPLSVQKTLFQGVTYRRDVQRSPVPLVVHVLTVDLHAPGIAFLVTPGDPNAKFPLRAQTTSRFRETYKTQIAVNGDYFFPYYSHSILSYYPHVGDPVDVEGVSASRGVSYGETSPVKRQFPTLYISQDNQARFFRPVGPVYNAISGLVMLLQHGRNTAPRYPVETPEPCTAVALDRDRTHMLLVMVDGRQPNYSDGMTLYEFAELVKRYGGYDALDLDGGGSEALVMEDANGKTRVLNAPLDGHIPGRERAVANHLGIFARPAPSP